MVVYKKKFYVDPDPTHTKFLMNKSTGKMMGRRKIHKNERQDKILNIRNSENGQLYGFTPKGITTIRGSSIARGSTRIRREL